MPRFTILTSINENNAVENYVFFTEEADDSRLFYAVQNGVLARERYGERVVNSTDGGKTQDWWPKRKHHGEICYIRRTSPHVFGCPTTIHKTEAEANASNGFAPPPYLDVNYVVVKGTLFYAS